MPKDKLHDFDWLDFIWKQLMADMRKQIPLLGNITHRVEEEKRPVELRRNR
jgi:hypothetical protein